MEEGSSDKGSKYVPVNQTKNCTLLGIAQRVVAVPYRRFGTIALSHLQGSRILGP
jgi:hypothetical protein